MLIYPYKPYSKGARALARGLRTRRIKHEGSAFRGRQTKTVINWGSSELPEEVLKCQILNPPHLVKRASHKEMFFKHVTDLQRSGETLVPEFTCSQEEARGWVQDGIPIMARTLLEASSGRGIVYITSPEEMVYAPLYVKYIKKSHEYRVHIFRGRVFDVQRKARRTEDTEEDVNWKIRTHTNGFIFIRNTQPPQQQVIDKALRVMEILELDFGAVDVIWNTHYERAYVLEVNTAPGLEETTLDNYVTQFNNLRA